MKNLSKMVEDFSKLLIKDPNSKAFAPLAEALREMQKFSEAEKVAVSGVKRHPSYVGGYLALGRIMFDQSRLNEAGPLLKKAIDLDPQNLLALQLYAQFLLQSEQAKDALKIYKRILFLNPQSEKARVAVQKLESLTADEFEEDIFQYQKLSTEQVIKETQHPLGLRSTDIDRRLSLVDALIVRNEIEKARSVLEELNAKAPGHREILRRFELLEDPVPEEEATPIQPLKSREKLVIDRKIKLLESLLHRINAEREDSFVSLDES